MPLLSCAGVFVRLALFPIAYAHTFGQVPCPRAVARFAPSGVAFSSLKKTVAYATQNNVGRRILYPIVCKICARLHVVRFMKMSTTIPYIV